MMTAAHTAKLSSAAVKPHTLISRLHCSSDSFKQCFRDAHRSALASLLACVVLAALWCTPPASWCTAPIPPLRLGTGGSLIQISVSGLIKNRVAKMSCSSTYLQLLPSVTAGLRCGSGCAEALQVMAADAGRGAHIAQVRQPPEWTEKGALQRLRADGAPLLVTGGTRTEVSAPADRRLPALPQDAAVVEGISCYSEDASPVQRCQLYILAKAYNCVNPWSLPIVHSRS